MTTPFFSPPGPATKRLFAFPHAGGADQEPQGWSHHDLSIVPVLLPGRGRRMRERSYRAMEPLVSDLADALPDDDVPFVFYGHSFGSWVAFELTRELRRRGRPLPELLVLGARGAPGRPMRGCALANLPVEEFVDEVATRFGGIDPRLRANLPMLSLFLQPLRSDIRILERWRPVEEPPLPIPLLVVHAEDDASLDPSDLAAWPAFTTADCTFRTVQGGHFFHRDLNIPSILP